MPQELDQVKQLLLRSAHEEPDFSNQKRTVPDFDLDLSGLVESIGMLYKITCIKTKQHYSISQLRKLSYCTNSRLSTLIKLLFSFDQNMRVEKTPMQTLACQLSGTVMQLLFSFDRDIRVEKTLIQTLACQLSKTLMQLLFSFNQKMKVEKTPRQTVACELSPIVMQYSPSSNCGFVYFS